MKSYKTTTVVDAEGHIELADIPFEPGERVEVVVQSRRSDDANRVTTTEDEKHPFKGIPVRYDRPYDPAVPNDDWEALR